MFRATTSASIQILSKFRSSEIHYSLCKEYHCTQIYLLNNLHSFDDLIIYYFYLNCFWSFLQ